MNLKDFAPTTTFSPVSGKDIDHNSIPMNKVKDVFQNIDAGSGIRSVLSALLLAGSIRKMSSVSCNSLYELIKKNS